MDRPGQVLSFFDMDGPVSFPEVLLIDSVETFFLPVISFFDMDGPVSFPEVLLIDSVETFFLPVKGKTGAILVHLDESKQAGLRNASRNRRRSRHVSA